MHIVVWPKSSAHLLYYDHHEESTRRPTCTSFHECCLPPPRLLRRVVSTINRIRKNNVGINFRISDGKIWESLILSSEKNGSWELCKKQVNLSFSSKLKYGVQQNWKTSHLNFHAKIIFCWFKMWIFGTFFLLLNA